MRTCICQSVATLSYHLGSASFRRACAEPLLCGCPRSRTDASQSYAPSLVADPSTLVRSLLVYVHVGVVLQFCCNSLQDVSGGARTHPRSRSLKSGTVQTVHFTRSLPLQLSGIVSLPRVNLTVRSCLSACCALLRACSAFSDSATLLPARSQVFAHRGDSCHEFLNGLPVVGPPVVAPHSSLQRMPWVAQYSRSTTMCELFVFFLSRGRSECPYATAQQKQNCDHKDEGEKTDWTTEVENARAQAVDCEVCISTLPANNSFDLCCHQLHTLKLRAVVRAGCCPITSNQILLRLLSAEPQQFSKHSAFDLLITPRLPNCEALAGLIIELLVNILLLGSVRASISRHFFRRILFGAVHNALFLCRLSQEVFKRIFPESTA